MYISIQEKFVYFFGALAIYFFIRTYEIKKIFCFILYLLCTVLCIMGKETGVSLSMAFCVYSLLDILFFRRKIRLSFIHCGINFSVFAVYYFFIRRILHGYTGRYASNFNSVSMFNDLMKAPALIKCLFGFAIIWIIAFILLAITKKKVAIRGEALVFPLFLFAYLIILLPWGFSNYLLAPLAPMAMGMLYPIYALISKLHKRLSQTGRVSIVIVSFLALFFIVVPRISKMGDIRKIIDYMSVAVEKEPMAKYFFPPPFPESANAIRGFTGGNIIYLNEGVLAEGMLSERSKNYLIFGDECSKIKLKDVAIGNELYRNNTWRLFLVEKGIDNKLNFYIDFPKNFLQKFKDYLKKL